MGDTLTLAPAPTVAIPTPSTVTQAPILPDLKAAVTAAVTGHVSTVQSQASAVLTSLSSGVVAPATLSSLLPDLKAAVVNAIDTHVAAVTAQASGVEASLAAKVQPIVAKVESVVDPVVQKTEIMAKLIEADAVGYVGSAENWVVAEVATVKTDITKHPLVVGGVAVGLILAGWVLHPLVAFLGLFH